MATIQAFKRNLRDNDLRVVSALPAAASTTVNGTAIDTGVRTANADFAGPGGPGLELVTKVPALSTTILPDTRTLTVTHETSDDVAFGSGNVTLGTLVFTGASSAGAAAAELRSPLPSTLKRYVRAKFVTGASTTDASAVSAETCVVI